MSKFLYHRDPYLAEVETVVSDCFEEDGNRCLAVADCIFHPRGGGQKGDIGTVEVDGQAILVIDTVRDRYSDDGRSLLILRHEGSALDSGKRIQTRIDWNYRYRQMRLHGAVHLHHCMLEKVGGRALPHPVSSEIQDGVAANIYDTAEVTEELTRQATKEFINMVEAGAAVVTRDDAARDGFRWWECLGYAIPCGGTHLKDVAEIGAVAVTYSRRKGKPRVTIRLHES